MHGSFKLCYFFCTMRKSCLHLYQRKKLIKFPACLILSVLTFICRTTSVLKTPGAKYYVRRKKNAIDCLQKIGEPSYKKFKECLEESGQSLSIEILEGEERKENEEKYILTVMPHQRALRNCLPRLVECLEIDRLLDFIIAKDFIDNVKIRDIKEHITTSKKIRMLINCLLTKNESSYKKGKDCLKESGQSSLTDMLEGEERKQNEEKYILTGQTMAENFVQWIEARFSYCFVSSC